MIIPSILYRPTEGAAPAEMELVADSAVKFFTAKILESAAKGPDSVSSQAQYHNALSKKWGGRVEIILGGYAFYKAKLPLIIAVGSRLAPVPPHRSPHAR